MKIDQILIEYMFNFIDKICNKFGPRYSCSKSEREANIWIEKELGKFCDETHLDEFQTKPGLYPQGLIKVAGIFSLLSPLFLSFMFPFMIISSILIFLGLFVLISELIFMKEWISFLFKEKTSSNVFGIIKPTRDIRFRLIFEGHTDSAKEMNIASVNEKVRYFIGIFGFYFLIHTIIFSLWKFFALLVSGNELIILQWGIITWTPLDYIYYISLILFYPLFFLLIKGFLGKKVVLGANDNLSASAVVTGLAMYLKDNRPNNVEVWLCSQGSEEVGDKGARAFVKKYGRQGFLDNSYSVILECCGAADSILLVEKDMHNIIYDQDINNLLEEIHKELKEKNPDLLDLRKDNLKIGACDVVRYIEHGYKATALFGVEKNKNKAVNWHSSKDVPENIDKKVLSDFLKICVKFINKIDAQYESTSNN
jgi:hypothetical protein